MPDTNEIDEDNKLLRSFIGKTVVDAKWFDSNPNDDWTVHEVGQLFFDDGRGLEFGGWGYDASGAIVSEITPGE